jgi:hypothetical protein
MVDGGKVVSPMHRLHSTPQEHYYFYVSEKHNQEMLLKIALYCCT